MLRRMADKSQQRDIDDYLLKLRGMDGSEIGGVIVLAAHMRNRFLDGTGLDFLTPHAVTAADPSVVIELVKTAKDFQKKGHRGLINAAALFVWIHTLRATINPNLRVKAREMWGELARGFPHIEEGTRLIEELMGETLELSKAGTYPDGFIPQTV